MANVTSALELICVKQKMEAAMAKQTAESDAKELAHNNEKEKLKKMQQQIQSCRIDSPLGWLRNRGQAGTDQVCCDKAGVESS